jgi:hypothetical protein
MRQRPGDQPLPVRNNEPDIQSMVIDDIGKRRAVGIERYGTPLQPFNGRKSLRDIYEELLDAACYVKQRLVEEDLVDKYVDENAKLKELGHTLGDNNKRLEKELQALERQMSRAKEFYQGRIDKLESRLQRTVGIPESGNSG